MTAAILQGVPAIALNADLWIDLPERQSIRVLNLCVKLGARVVANTVVALEDDTLVNFLYRVDGIASFSTEARRALVLDWLGFRVKVLPLEKVIQSKEFVARPKDLAHLPLLRDVLAAVDRCKPGRRGKKKS
jgi:hypothetical protein